MFFSKTRTPHSNVVDPVRESKERPTPKDLMGRAREESRLSEEEEALIVQRIELGITDLTDEYLSLWLC